MEHTPNIVRRIIGELLAIQEKPIMQHTVKEFLWGYQDPLLHSLKTKLPELVTNDQVSVYYASVYIYLNLFSFTFIKRITRQTYDRSI